MLLVILIAVTTAPELEIPVNPPVIEVELSPLMVVLLIFKVVAADELIIPPNALTVFTPLITQLTIELWSNVSIAVDAAVTLWLRIPSMVPAKFELESVIVLLYNVEVKVPEGAPAEKFFNIPPKVKIPPDTVALVIVL